MINIVKIFSATITKGKRILKFLRLGKSDVQTSFESMPYGIDSSPLKNMKAVYLNTGEKGKSVIVGYINQDQISKVGETRLFSDKNYIYLSNLGDIRLGGINNNAVKYLPLNDGLNQHNLKINAELVKIQTAITNLGGSYVFEPITVDISSSKSDDVKMK